MYVSNFFFLNITKIKRNLKNQVRKIETLKNLHLVLNKITNKLDKGKFYNNFTIK